MKITSQTKTVQKVIEAKEKEVTLVLTEKDALRLMSVMGRFTGSGEIRVLTDNIYSGLRKALDFKGNQYLESPFTNTPHLSGEDVSFDNE